MVSTQPTPDAVLSCSPNLDGIVIYCIAAADACNLYWRGVTPLLIVPISFRCEFVLRTYAVCSTERTTHHTAAG